MSVLIKTAEEIEKMRIAGRLAGKVLEMIEPHVQAGITTGEIDQICQDYMTETLNAIPAALNYKGFPKGICASVNHQVCHGIPGEKRLKTGDIVSLDTALIKNGYYGDTCKTFYVGKPSIMAQRLTETAKEALYIAIKMVKPGIRLGDLGAAIQTYVEKHRFSVVREYCGHGVGANFHEAPNVLHFGTPGTGEILKPGMTFTIEPMINAGKRYVRVLPDQWTVVTKDRSLSAQWEHTILVTETGFEVLTRRAEEAAILGAL